MEDFPLTDLYAWLELFWLKGSLTLWKPDFWSIFTWPLVWRRVWLVLFPITIPATLILSFLRWFAALVWFLGGWAFFAIFMIPPMLLYAVVYGVWWLWTAKT